ncbi:MAG: hypothetical protein ABIR37_03045 [Candidatus Saccharimonadales bacterium]
MKNSELSLSSLTKSFSAFGQKLGRYTFLLFLIFLAAIYGFVLYRINTLAAAEPTDSATSQAISKTPHIDENVVIQLENLKDNSVSVQTLFEEARSNPFQE